MSSDRAQDAPTPRARRLAVSDVHGHVDVLRHRLHAHGVLDAAGEWTGGTTRVWFLGDYVDRGRQGLDVVATVRRMERAAARAGGAVRPLLGNHELQFLAALHFGDDHVTHDGSTTWREGWLRYGGVEEELRAVDEATTAWMAALPLVGTDGDDLLLHSDTDGYLRLGGTVEEINAAGREILAGRDVGAWALLHQVLVERHGFSDPDSLQGLLARLGARRVVHGHTPLMGGFGLPVEEAGRPHAYAAGRALAVDGGVFEGGTVLVADLGTE